MDEYLSGETVLGEYEYVHTCMKFDEDVVFTLMHADSVKQAYLRTVTYIYKNLLNLLCVYAFCEMLSKML